MAELKNIRIAISGIYDYAFEELPSLKLPLPSTAAAPNIATKRIYKVYRPSVVLEAAKDKFKMLPLTYHHPKVPVDGKNFRKLTVGYTGENPFIDYITDKNEVGIRSNVMLYDDEIIAAYNRGEIQLSPGYLGTFEWQSGTSPNGQSYDIIMKEITAVNHLALLPDGRGGAEAIILDKATEVKTVFDIARARLPVLDADFDEGDVKWDGDGKFASKEGEKEKKGGLKTLTKQEYKDFIKEAIEKKDNTRASLGSVSPEARARILKKTGKEVNRIIIDSGSIRHSLRRGDHNIKPDDLENIYDIVNNTETIVPQVPKHQNNDVIKFIEEKKNGINLVMEFRSKKRIYLWLLHIRSGLTHQCQMTLSKRPKRFKPLIQI